MQSRLAPVGVLALAIALTVGLAALIASVWWFILAVAPILIACLAYETHRWRRSGREAHLS